MWIFAGQKKDSERQSNHPLRMFTSKAPKSVNILWQKEMKVADGIKVANQLLDSEIILDYLV